MRLQKTRRKKRGRRSRKKREKQSEGREIDGIRNVTTREGNRTL
jgi:hypothetical protein